MNLRQFGVMCLFFLTFGAGSLFGKMLHFNIFTFSREINPVHAISVISTVFVALFVAVLIDRNKSRDRCEKELFLKRIDAIIAIAECLHDRISGQKILFVEATTRLKRMKSSVKCVYTSFTTASRRIGVEEKQIKDILKELNTLMTMTPIKSGVGAPRDDSISIKNGIVTYSVTRSAAIEVQIEAFKDVLFKMQVDINNCYQLG